MLGLRRSPLSKRTTSSSSTSQQANKPEPNTEPIKPVAAAMPATMEKEKPASNAAIITKPNANGITTNGSTANGEHVASYSQQQQITIIEKTVVDVRRKINTELDSEKQCLVDEASIETFLEYIAKERLTRMPHRGSRWDKVLKWAEYFAIQVSEYQKIVKAFLPGSDAAAKLAWGNCRVLLEMGPSQAVALEKSFAIFYRLALVLATFLRNRNLFGVSGEIRQALGEAYVELLILVTDVTVQYNRRINEMTGTFVTVDFNSIFGRKLGAFYMRKDRIADAMWSYQLQRNASTKNSTVNIEHMRKWLAPRDTVLQNLSSDRMASRNVRDEFTCEWFQKNLLDFARSHDEVMAINGEVGCGKSVLSGWIVERLQRPLGRKSYETLSHIIDSDVPSETTTFSLVKHLLSQLLEQKVGNVSLYQSIAAAFEMSSKFSNNAKVEDALWSALETAVKTSENLIIVIDGVDKISGGETSYIKLFERLHDLAAKHNTVKTVLLSRPLSKPFSKPCRHFSITPDHTHNDIRHMVMASLTHYHHFHDQSHRDQETIIERITHGANGSFVWADLTMEILKKEKTHEGFIKSLETTPKPLVEVIQKLLKTVNLTSNETKLMLSWFIAAERPLTITEVKHLYEVDVHKKNFFGRNTDIEDDIRHVCGSLLIIKDGAVRFRHASIKQYMLDMSNQGKFLMPLKDAQRDLTIRILTYVKICLTQRHEPSFDPLQHSNVNELFHSHHLLEYTVRYWAVHFHQSHIAKPDGTFDFPNEFQSVFPSSTLFPMLEGSCWETQMSVVEAINMHKLSLRIRQHVFSEKHDSVLQSVIIVATTYRKISSVTEASVYFYQASCLGQTLLGKFSLVSVTAATAYLTCTQSITSSTRTEVIIHKEEMLKFIIAAHKHQHGASSDLTIKYQKILAQLYTEIHEEKNAALIYREVYDSTVDRYGQFSKEATSVSKELVIVLQKDTTKREDIVQYTKPVFRIAEDTMDITDTRRINVTIEMAKTYELRKDFLMAEEIYVNLWRRVVDTCRTKKTVENQERKIEVTMTYVEFLRRYQRNSEASSILLGLWSEYQHETISSETLILRLKRVGEEMKAIGLVTAALSVFTSVWGYFKRSSKQTSSDAVSTAVLLAESAQEVQTHSHKHSVTTTTVFETILREIFESTMSRSVVDITTIKTCNTLSLYYVSHKRWSEATKVTHDSLRLIWNSLITGSGKITLPDKFISETITMAERLAFCYHKEKHIEKAEHIYVSVFRATKNSLRIDDETVNKSSQTLILFYEETSQFHKVIGVYEELVQGYRTSLGATHTVTIKTLYTLGSLCVLHKHKDAGRYYLEIVTSLNKGSDVCHHDALEAGIILSKIYHDEQHWTEMQKICHSLWQSFIKHGKEYNMTAEVVQTIYHRYTHVLEKEIKVEYSILRQVAIEYRETTFKVFGAHSTITIKAAICLAQINEKSEKHQQEAINIYEEVIRETKTSTTTAETTSVISRARELLAHLYISTTSSTANSTSVQKAVILYSEQFEQTKAQHGCSHESTLSTLTELVKLLRKQNTQQSHASAVREMQVTTIEIITRETSSKKLFESAMTMASTYRSCGYTEQGYELLRELRRQIISEDMRSSEKAGFKLSHAVGRSSYVFLVTFEETLAGSTTISFSEIMADLLTETILYEHYTRSIKADAKFESIMINGARLRSFLVDKKRQDQSTILEQQLYEKFIKVWGASIKTNKQSWAFFIVLLIELSKDKHTVHVGNSASTAGNHHVWHLLQNDRFQEAYDFATCVFQFSSNHRGYHETRDIGNGFKLSLYMAGRGAKKCPEEKLRIQMLDLSKLILRDVLKICRELKINFVQIPLAELNDLVSLMGEQQNFGDLEWLLAELWHSRQAQKTWSPSTIVGVGRRLVEVRFTHGHRDAAIRLCEDICYNLRNVWGNLDKTTLEMFTLLSQLYTAAGQYRDAMGVHEETLRLSISGEDEDSVSDAEAAQIARTHLDLMKRSYQRLGGWDKNPETYKELYSDLADVYAKFDSWKGVQSLDKWSSKGSSTDQMGMFSAPASWEFADLKNEDGKVRRDRLRVSSANWGLKAHGGREGVNGGKGGEIVV